MAPGSPSLRQANVEVLSRERFDVLVVGGGINGAVSAAALASRGAKVALVDRGDFACATSQESSNLIWGGIKYLESYELGLVRKLCRARNALLRSYPSSVRELRFFTSHPLRFRWPLWLLVLGAWLYWLLGSAFTRRPRLLTVRDIAREEPRVALDGVDGGFEYSDAYLPDSDARFVWGFVRTAVERGCAAANYVESLGSRREGEEWLTTARDRVGGRELTIRSRVLINACGPYADGVNARTGVRTGHRHVLSKGIHLVVDRLVPTDRALTFFADDGRLFFALPMGARTCIGTTDTPVDSPDEGVTAGDRRFVLENINKRLRLPRPLSESDVVAERCGVRPLVVDADFAGGRDWVQLSRRHVIEVDAARRHVTIFGGKLTDCLNVGEEICAEIRRLGVALPHADGGWFGEPDAAARRSFLEDAARFGLDDLAPPGAAERLWRRYGERASRLLDSVRRDATLAREVLEGGEVLRCEVEEAARSEMVTSLDDFLRRRTALAQVVCRDALRASAGLRDACRVLFGDAAEARRAEYFGAVPHQESQPASRAPDERPHAVAGSEVARKGKELALKRTLMNASDGANWPARTQRSGELLPRGGADEASDAHAGDRGPVRAGEGAAMRLTLRQVRKVVNGEVHLHGIDLELEPGSFSVLLGPTQAGKTSLLRLMAGLDHATSGAILEDGVDVTRVDVRRRNVAMVYQEFVNYPSFTVYDNIAAPLRVAKRLPRAEVDARVRATAETLRIDRLLDRLPAELSGGQQQRVALARALVKDARLLLLDEPLLNLDYKLREEMRSELRQLFGHGRTTVVYATTEPAEGLLFGGRTGVLDAGRLLQYGPGIEVYHRPATTRVSEVFSDPPINLVPARIGVDGCRLSSDVIFPLGEHMRSLSPGDYRVGLRANQLEVAGRAGDAGVVRATVELAEINGSETYVHARHQDFTVIAQLEGVHEFALGAPVNLRFDANRLFVFDGAGRLAAAPNRHAGGGAS
ncbi:MAG TPA: FAD-dependent oxidoreductase [Anaeromyxobacteraceae bacterium]|nr:FAD-dependent oxidoreductase [Anaeromyxobacteraceae bacterium]